MTNERLNRFKMRPREVVAAVLLVAAFTAGVLAVEDTYSTEGPVLGEKIAQPSTTISRKG